MLTPLFLQTAASRAADFWPMVFPLTLGMLAVYWLLPRPKPFPLVYGAAAAALAILLAGWSILRLGAATAEGLLFYAFSAIAVVSGGLLITQRNPARAALSFALVVLSTCGLFLLQAAPFLMAATIIIYAGAIIVTFLFVLMLAQQHGPSDADDRSREPLLAAIAGFVLLGALLFMLNDTYNDPELDSLIRSTDHALARVEGLEQRQASETNKPSADEVRGALEEVEQLVGEPVEKKLEGKFPAWKPRPAQYTRDNLAPIYSAITNTRAAEDVLVQPLKRNQEVHLDELAARLQELRAQALVARNSAGFLAARDLPQPYSEFSRPSISERRDGQGRPEMPAENVEYLGRTLFTDYLVAVELGGTLLLVATIGAIAIATRRAERVA